MFIRFNRMHERDRHTHTHKQTPHDDIGRACIASCGKNLHLKEVKHQINDSLILH